MPRFFLRQEHHSLAYQRVALQSRTTLNRARSHAFGLHRLGPYGQAVQQFEAALVELGPFDSGRIKVKMCIYKESTE